MSLSFYKEAYEIKFYFNKIQISDYPSASLCLLIFIHLIWPHFRMLVHFAVKGRTRF